MKKFDVLEHTADAKFKAYGKSIEQAYENAAFAMVGLMYNHKMVAALDIEEVVVEGKDMEQLLYNFLEELLVLQDAKMFVMHGFVKAVTITAVKDRFRLRAEIIGDEIKEEYEVRPVVKAMTYAEIKISEKPIYVQFVVDI